MIAGPENQVIKTNNARIAIVDNDIFYLLYDADVALELSDFKESHSVYEKIAQKKDYKVIIEFPRHTFSSPEARNYAMETPFHARAEAIVFKTLSQRLIVRFYLMTHKQDHPVKIFTETEQAMAWLKTV